ncbi:3-hydroxyacyl-CoA dehydrogenase NAD-binding domain-containing protein [Chelatococcus reniformis]|uniref:enoyl-CoA hydratase n=1 Tax=Chelatococcus reniformis TaxID=1494448 RepID=A0A916URQ3_9HYPH|nr:3-hydroxyacyl-CoA dehydrogenase NAD-binding domain-containing protein [Chelatococcus reniformis]GGC83521.1 enoyl-CoA hydratase [Chelatococcus reniformis]
MKLANFTVETDADGIALVSWDQPERSMNVITPDMMADLATVIDTLAADAAVKGIVVTSAKSDFSAGADLTMLQGVRAEYRRRAEADGQEAALAFFFEETRKLSLLYRKLETCGKPVAAAIRGLCLGGGFELALACHHRVLSDDASSRVGLPEIKVGLFPGGGGTQRVARLLATPDALQFLFRGEQIKPAMAKTMGLVHAVVAGDQVVQAAKDWIKGGGKAVAPWDVKGFKAPSGKVFSPVGMQIFPAANAIYRRETYDNYPAAKAILASVYEGLQLPMDLALKVESRYFAKILRSKEAAAMIRSLFVSMGELNKGARRPVGVPASELKTIGIVGAGFMGAGIAYVTAEAGMNVVLLDRDLEAAEKGKAYSDNLMAGRIKKGRAKPEAKEALLARIRTTADYADLKDCDLIIEAVFEDPKIKADVIASTEAVIAPQVVFASNTSTLPITGLARASSRPDQFVGIHFFSPVEKMLLVEIIKGKKTGDKALAAALDYVRAIKKTPIVVNDARGFYANRCVGAYIREGHLMLMEGVPPAMIETVAKMAGMPVGPLSLNDEVAIDLGLKIARATKAELGEDAVDPEQEKLLVAMVETHGRLGRKNGKGFYDYPENGPKRLWPGVADLQREKLDADAIDVEMLKQRFLVAQALEAARSFEEGIVTDAREADVGSIIGFGFAPFTGGTLSYIDGMGAKAFVELCKKLEKACGARFKPNRQLVKMAKAGGSYYGAEAPAPTREAA